MFIGVPKEIKEKEFRVGIVPAGVKALTEGGHAVLIETRAGEGSGIADSDYETAGATLVSSPEEVYGRAELVMKVKEPLGDELSLLRAGQILFTYLHLAPAPDFTDSLLQSKIRAVAYETVELDNGFLPLLAPMSQVAGRMAIQEGARFLEKEEGGRGVLLAGVPGVAPGHVTILGSGTVATHAAQMAIGLGAHTTILARNLRKLAELDSQFQGRLTTLALSQHSLEEELTQADLLVSAIYATGRSAPKLVSRAMLGLMKKGAVIVDVAIDQGGCLETSRPTYHSDPVFEVDGILHYCVANMPGAVPWTSTFALTNATLPYCLAMANQGLETAARQDRSLMRGINLFDGQLVNKQVAESQQKSWQELLMK
jgi:alanine dehydrogenase